MDEQIIGKKLTALNIAERKFTANGKTYLIEESLSEKRYIKWEMLQAQVGLNIHFENLKEKMNQLWANLNKQNFADSCVIARDIMEGMNRNYEERIPDCIQMCALFMNTEDEDRRFITDDLIKQKAADWRAEGIDMQSFFSFAVATIPGLINNFKNITRATSES